MKTNPNDTAFAYGTDNYDYKGLTKREHFAGLAMQGVLAHGQGVTPNQAEDVAKYSLQLADALIAELNRTQD